MGERMVPQSPLLSLALGVALGLGSLLARARPPRPQAPSPSRLDSWRKRANQRKKGAASEMREARFEFFCMLLRVPVVVKSFFFVAVSISQPMASDWLNALVFFHLPHAFWSGWGYFGAGITINSCE